MQVSIYKLVGLEKLYNEEYMSATIQMPGKEENQKALIEGDKPFKDALWNYCKGNWGNLIAIVKHEGSRDNPVDPIVHKVEHDI